MREADFDAFSALLADVWSLKGQALSGSAKAMWFRSLAAFPLDAVRGALDAHLADPERGRFLPMPADVIAQLDRAVAADGRPGPEEAWALALRSTDEADTVVWTAEVSEALGIARPVLDAAGAISGRLAFLEAYGRLLAEARRLRRPAAWRASLGFDARQRDSALAEAVHRGHLAACDVPTLPGPAVPLLEAASAEGVPPEARAALLTLRAWLTRSPEDGASTDAQAKAETERLRERAAQQVDDYHGSVH